jgi:hypothetical protein
LCMDCQISFRVAVQNQFNLIPLRPHQSGAEFV